MKTIQSITMNKVRTVVGRILPGVDLIQGIQDMCGENEVRFGVITAVLGSLSEAGIVYAIPDKNKKMGIRYSDPTYFEGPLELLCCQGIIGENEDGEFQIHLHGIMGDKNLNIKGGHFLPNENKVLATAEIMILETSEAEFIRQYDEKTGFELFNFYKKKHVEIT